MLNRAKAASPSAFAVPSLEVLRTSSALKAESFGHAFLLDYHSIITEF